MRGVKGGRGFKGNGKVLYTPSCCHWGFVENFTGAVIVIGGFSVLSKEIEGFIFLLCITERIALASLSRRGCCSRPTYCN
jgi:hypothetical protein